MKFNQCLVATILFCLFLGVIHYSHITLFRIDVIFYTALADVFLATLAAAVVLYTTVLFRALGRLEKAQLLIIWLLLGYAFAISIPTVIDRSLSFYILEKLQQRGGGIKQTSLEEVFTKEYVKEHRLIDVRLTEQLESGTIIIKNGCVKLTEKGEWIANFSRFYRQHLLPKKRLLMGEYTDELTNPFRHSAERKEYICQ